MSLLDYLAYVSCTCTCVERWFDWRYELKLMHVKPTKAGKRTPL